MKDVVYAANDAIVHSDVDMHTKVMKCAQATMGTAGKLLLRSE